MNHEPESNTQGKDGQIEAADKKMFRGSFAASLIFHGIILLIIGGLIVVPGAVQKFMPVSSVPSAPPQIPEPPKVEEETSMDQSPDAGGSPVADQIQEASSPDPSQVDALVVDSPVPTPHLNASPGATGVTSDVLKKGGGLGGSGGGTGSGIGKGSGKGVSFFGSKEKISSGLVGVFYDLKQSRDRKATPFTNCQDYSQVDAYFKVQDEFIKKGWDDSLLSSKYYHAPTALYATQFWIPMIASEEAPKAFGVEKECEGGYWLAHYKGKIAPPKDGTYRFVGFADCQIFVAVNKKLVLESIVAPYPTHRNLAECPLTGSFNYKDGGGLRAGTWMNLKASDPVELDILWGDEHGHCACFLMMEEKGANYEMDNDHPILPIFQLSPQEVPVVTGDVEPLFAKSPAIWKGFGVR